MTALDDGALARLRAALQDAGADSSLVPGRVVAGKYRLEERIGEGGMGVVVAARHLELDALVAIKFLRAGLADDGRLLREARAAARLENEHVVRVLDVGCTDDGAPFIVMEHLNGTDLARTLAERGPLPIAEAVGFVLEACEGVAEAHALGIVHRDLKPSNLFLASRRNGTSIVKVLDFGISKLTRRRDDATTGTVTTTGPATVVGSVGYMAPEQLHGSAVDARTDVWALGVVLFELITAKRPFDGATAAAVGARIAAAEPTRLRELAPHAPADLEAAVLRCLAKAPGERFADVQSLARALARIAPRAEGGSPGRVVRSPGRRVIVATLLAAAGAGSIVLVARSRQGTAPPAPAASGVAAAGSGGPAQPPQPPQSPVASSAADRAVTVPDRGPSPSPDPPLRPSRASAPRAVHAGAPAAGRSAAAPARSAVAVAVAAQTAPAAPSSAAPVGAARPKAGPDLDDPALQSP